MDEKLSKKPENHREFLPPPNNPTFRIPFHQFFTHRNTLLQRRPPMKLTKWELHNGILIKTQHDGVQCIPNREIPSSSILFLKKHVENVAPSNPSISSKSTKNSESPDTSIPFAPKKLLRQWSGDRFFLLPYPRICHCLNKKGEKTGGKIMSYRYAKHDKKKIKKDIVTWINNRYNKLGYNFTFKTKDIPLTYCNSLMGKIINEDLTQKCMIINKNSRTHRWKTKLNGGIQ